MMYYWSIGNMMYYWSIGNMMYYWSIGNMMYYWSIGNMMYYWSIGNMMYYWSIGNMMYYWSIGNMMYYWSIGRNGKVWTYQQQPGTPMYDKIIRNGSIRQKSKADLFLATVPIEHSFFICSVVSLRQILPTSGCEPITSCEPLMLIFTNIGEVELLPLYL